MQHVFAAHEIRRRPRAVRAAAPFFLGAIAPYFNVQFSKVPVLPCANAESLASLDRPGL